MEWGGMIKNIRRLKQFGIFRDYKKSDMKDFGKFNLFYGWNGSGKSTLSSLFRDLSQGGKQRPLLMVLEEAHSYLGSRNSDFASQIIQKIVKEGRKYGIGVMIVSQRPSEINPTILSQCGTFIAMRLANSTDRGHVSSALSDNLESLTNMLPVLRTGEAIILGESVRLPMRAIIQAPPKDKRPDSQDPIVYDTVDPENSMEIGGWGLSMESEPNYKEVVDIWRTRNMNKKKAIKTYNVVSSNVASIGYDDESKTMEVAFHNGATYQYFDVPGSVFENFRNAESQGNFLHREIKGIYRYARI